MICPNYVMFITIMISNLSHCKILTPVIKLHHITAPSKLS